MPSNSTIASDLRSSSRKPFYYWLAIAWRLFKRELGRGELTIITLSIILAVSSVMALSSITDRVRQSILNQSVAFMAADKELVSSREPSIEYVKKAEEFGLQTDRHMYFRSVVFAGDNMHLAVIKAVTPSYPLRGELFISKDLTAPETISAKGPNVGEVWLNKRLFYALELDDSDVASGNQKLEVGELSLAITGILESEPDAPFEVFDSGTRVLMHIDDVAATEVVQPGSRISYAQLYAGKTTQLKDFEKWVTPQLEKNEQFRGVAESGTQVAASFDRAEGFLMLAGVLGVILAATAVAVATRLYSQRHLDSIAIFKTLGASLPQVKVVYLFQLILITVFSVVVGVLLGLVMQAIAVDLMAEFLPDDLPAIGYKPLVMATVTGFMCALMFSIPSLLKLFSVPPLRVLRRNLGDDIATSITARILMVLTTVALIWIYSQDLKLTAIMMAGGVALIVIILLVAAIMLKVSRVFGTSVGGSSLKIALASLKRRSRENSSQLVGFTLAIMLTLVLFSLENTIIKEWQEQIPEGTPNQFVVNIAQHELQQVKTEFAAKNIEPENYYPMVRGRLTHVNNEELLQPDLDNGGAKLRSGNENESDDENKADKNTESTSGRVGIGRELNLTFTEKWAENNTLLEGEWMTPGKPNQVSVESGVAERVGLKLGDMLTLLIGAQEVSVEVTSIREVDWNSFQPNFYLIMSNDVFADFPATYITSFYVPQEQKMWVTQFNKRFPTITIIDTDAIIGRIQDTIKQVAIAIRVVLLVVVAAATLVLLAQVLSSLDERRRETVIFRTLGAKSSMIQNAIVFEFLILGGIAGLVAATVADVSLYLLQSQLFEMDWHLHTELWLIGPLSGALFVALVGGVSTRSLMKMTPTELIRQLS